MIALGLVAFLGVAWVLLFALGEPLRRLLPGEWRSYAVVLSPLLGYALLLLIGYYAVRTALDLTAASYAALGLALVLNGWALWRGLQARQKRPDRPEADEPRPRPRLGDLLDRIGGREHGPALLLAAAAFLLAVLPLLSYGYSVPIGENWDPENYLPIATYLRQAPAGQLPGMLPNPLRDLNASPPRIGMSLGFCVLLGTLSWPPAWDALRAFAPTIALLCGLTALAWYALFRAGFAMGRPAGTLAAACSSLSALALWVAFFNFGMQLAAMPLVPLALLLWLLALRQPSWRTVLLAGTAVAVLPVAYYPALTIFVPLALGLGLYEVLRQWGGRRTRPAPAAAGTGDAPRGAASPLRAPLAGLAAAVVSVVLAIGPILDYGQGFSFRYGQQMTTLGLFHFPSLAQALGLAPFSRTPEALPGAWQGLVVASLALVLLAAAAVLWPRRPSWMWIAAAVPALLYLAWLRGLILPLAEALHLAPDLLERLRPYPYAFLKGVVFVSPVVWGLAVAHWERALQALARGPDRRGRVLRAVLVAAALLPLILVLAADAHLVARYWGRPAHYDAQALSVEHLVRAVPAGEEVYLTGRPERSRVLLGLYSYFLLQHPVQGRLSTGYAGYDRRLPGAEARYALLDVDDDPYPLGFAPSRSAGPAGGMALYERAPGVLSFLDLRSDAYSGRPGGEVHTKQPLTERLLQSFGDSPLLAADRPLILYADGRRLSLSDDLPGESAVRPLLLSLAAFEPATVTLRWADGAVDRCTLPPGVSECLAPPHSLPGRVEIVPQDGAAVWLLWAALLDELPAAPGVQPVTAEAALLSTASAEGTVFEIQARLHNATGRPLRLALEVWENTFSGAAHYAWWGPLPLPDVGTVRLRADLGARAAQAWQEQQEAPFAPHPGAAEWPAATDGTYFAALWVYYGGQVVAVLPVGQFAVAAGQVQDLVPIQPGLRLLGPQPLPEPSGARFGPAIELSTYELDSRSFAPGDAVPLALEWHAEDVVPVDYIVTAQILKDGRLWGQWDGPIGQWYGASAWKAGQFVRDDIPLQLSAEAAPGRYRLIVAVYDPATGVRLPVQLPSGQEGSDFLDLGEIVVR